MKRIKFRKGEQRKFIDSVLAKIGSPSLRKLSERGIDVSYSTLKNYYSEKRLLPEDLFKQFCYLAEIDEKDLDVKILEKNWGQVVGGKKGKRKV
jgi:hypothetical protein